MSPLKLLGKKVVAGVLSITFVASLCYAPFSVPRAHATGGVLDTNATDVATFAYYVASEAAQADTAVNTTGELLISKILNGIAWAVAKAVVQSMTQSIVQWINSGFEGSPAFATNLKQNLRQLGDAAVFGFVKGILDNTAINSPFLVQAAGLATRGYLLYTSKDAIVNRIRYTLNEYSQNEEAFRRGQFNQGGFNAFFALNSECGNDPFCVQSSVQEELVNQVDRETRQRLNELDWGRGFLSWRNCPDATQSDGTDTTVGATELSDADRTANCTINTPGSVIEGQLEHQLGTGLRQLELADSINEIVGALASQLVSKVLGATGLLGSTQPSSGSGRSALQSLGQSTLNGSNLINGFQQEVTRARATTNTNKSKWETLRALAMRASEECISVGADAAKKSEADAVVTQADQMMARATATSATLSNILSRMVTILGQATSTNPAAAGPLVQEFNSTMASGSVEIPPDTLTTRMNQIIDGRCR